ncbi:MAG: hypothetical protein NZ528_10285 [Caldilineales bacterium]|nr:hypothetical protein [Caldilineales bacterium]MDW8317679.1 hypothetical protein [Anaerolineae bacterium]
MDATKRENLLLLAEAMAQELSDYLLGDSLYRQLIVKTPQGVKQPKMSLGALLEHLEALTAAEAEMTPDQRQRLRAVQEQVTLARRSFAEQWRAKLRRELHGLLSSWRWYLEDAAQNVKARQNYPTEVSTRTRLALLLEALGNEPEVADDRRELAQLDRRLQAMFQRGAYIGPREEQARYPADRAWWLYGRLKDTDE